MRTAAGDEMGARRWPACVHARFIRVGVRRDRMCLCVCALASQELKRFDRMRLRACFAGVEKTS